MSATPEAREGGQAGEDQQQQPSGDKDSSMLLPVQREPLTGYEELVTEEDIVAMERARRGLRRPSWKLLNPPKKKKPVDEGNATKHQVQPRLSPRKSRRSSPDYADLLPSDDEDNDSDDDRGHRRRRRGRSREFTTADIGKKDVSSPRLRPRLGSRDEITRRRGVSPRGDLRDADRRGDYYRRRMPLERTRYARDRFEDHYKKYTTVEDQRRIQDNRVAGISDFLAWAKDAKKEPPEAGK
ncbi:hypothetical protein FOL47_011340 [Perkinsus chesapeaki]|uniref:Uncharacterized protein n=1 Tax=Perkinsus chesapeaki TaxID=330153 RepID=A0A7J6KZB2_PERCH|nr:hypothetical protein FOL47_011340 [Perkinsus chesapeaki]